MTEGRRYRVLGTLGRGGFGTVYRAELLGEGGFAKPVALKVLNPDMAEVAEVASRLRDEARVLGLLRHRAIVQVDGLVLMEGRWTVVMEYVEGVDLGSLAEAAGPFPVTAALEICSEVASALHIAYTRVGDDGRALCLLHRDIKPSNIQVTAAGETKLLDFGVARAEFEGREAETRSLMFGSVGYMSPERLDFIDGPAGDVYALGAVLYELVGGEPFGKTSSKFERHRARLGTGTDHLRDLGVDDDVVELVVSLLAYEPAERPPAREVERRCVELRSRLRGPSLRDWAEEVVPPLVQDRPLGADSLSGSILIERTGSQDLPPRAEASSAPARSESAASASSDAVRVRDARGSAADRRGASGFTTAPMVRTVGAVVVASTAGLGLLLAALLGGWLLLRGRPPQPGQAQADQAQADQAQVVPDAADPLLAAEAPEVEEAGSLAAIEAAAEPRPDERASRKGRVPSGDAHSGDAQTLAASVESASSAPIPPSSPTSAPTGPASASPVPPEAPAAHTGIVRVEGDARTVFLVAEGRRHATGAVEARSYTIEAVFGERPAVIAGSVTVPPGGELTLLCNSVFTRCTIR